MKTMARCSIVFAVLAGVLPATQAPDDYLAPANCWTTQGGGPARSGATHTRPLRGPVEVAWSHDAQGTLESEPLVWHDVVLIAIARGGDQRLLRAIDLTTGKKLVDRAVRSKEPLSPSLWGNVVAYREGTQQATAVRIGKSLMTEVWRARSDASIGPPLLVDGRVYVSVGSAVTCYELGRRTPLWSGGRDCLGAVSLIADRLYVQSRLDGGRIAPAAFRRATGDELELGPLEYAPVASSANAQIALLPGALFVDDDARDDSTVVRSLPASYGIGWIGHVRGGSSGRELIFDDDPSTPSVRVLANATLHPEFVADDLPVSVAGAVAFAGASAFEIETGRILWKLPLRATQRPVLARETVLLVEDGKRLVAVRSKNARMESLPLTVGAATTRGTLVLRDDSLEAGEFTIDGAAQLVARVAAKPKPPWKLSDVLLIEDEQHRVVAGSDPLRGIQRIVEAALADGYVDLAKQARASNDGDLIEQMIGLALLHGAEAKELEESRRFAESLGKRESAVRAAQAKQVRERADELARKPAAMLLERVRALPDELRPRLDTKLLRAVLEIDPDSAEVRDAVRALLPEELRPAGEFDVRDSLVYVEATRRTPVTFVPAPTKDTGDLDYASRQIGWRLSTWSKALYGVRSENLLIITPVKKPGTLARCLAVGELVCRMLGELVAAGVPARDVREPMVIELFATRDEYLRLADHDRGGHDRSAELQWTAGHYDTSRNVSRFYFPDSDEELEQVLSTAAHELTHHWLRARCPLWPYQASSDEAVLQPGYWVIEGFASFIEDFALDVESGTWTLDGATSPRLDLLANSREEHTLPWEVVLEISHGLFQAVQFDKELPVQSSMYLGMRRIVTGRTMFYAQSAATVRYLYEAEDGALRSKLFDFLHAFYTRDASRLDLPQLVGLDVRDLGKRVTEFARRIVERP